MLMGAEMRRTEKRLSLTAIILIASLSGGASVDHALNAEEHDQDAHIVKAREAASQLGSRLQQKLKNAIQQEGPVAAINVCAAEAPDIAEQVSEEFGLEIGRRALKVRNPNSQPDDWELEALHYFQSLEEKGQPIKGTEWYEIINTDNGREFRWSMAIPTGGVCLACHGTNINPALKAEIQKLYPEDQAVGFEAGSLRGIFSAKTTLPKNGPENPGN